MKKHFSNEEKAIDIHLYTAPTMNGWKPVILLEELGVNYNVTHVDFSKNEQRNPHYLNLNPNGRIPTIVDVSNNDFVVFESGAILWYLAEKYNKFLPSTLEQKSQTLQWLIFQVGGIGPMMGQAMFFQRIAARNGNYNPSAIKRYVDESRRLLEVLNKRLEDRNYLVDEQYTIADIATYPWARAYFWANVSIDGLHHLKLWLARIDSREKTSEALEIPRPFWAFFGKGNIDKQEKENADWFKG